jgi:hypothetical protein
MGQLFRDRQADAESEAAIDLDVAGNYDDMLANQQLSLASQWQSLTNADSQVDQGWTSGYILTRKLLDCLIMRSMARWELLQQFSDSDHNRATVPESNLSL